ncbi:Uncharacterised protein [Serratia marcescens]|uniref:Uncharacterized protein n=1 Tax=Serratia marcescens TaxID=615 RepID=A0A379Y2G8_SERMA|nr:Uncharacterised protein [Serratia marcescens]
MKPLLLKQPLPELLEIGSVSNLGATVIAGTPNVGVASIFGEPTDKPELRRVQLHPRQLRDGVSVRRARHGVGR